MSRAHVARRVMRILDSQACCMLVSYMTLVIIFACFASSGVNLGTSQPLTSDPQRVYLYPTSTLALHPGALTAHHAAPLCCSRRDRATARETDKENAPNDEPRAKPEETEPVHPGTTPPHTARRNLELRTHARRLTTRTSVCDGRGRLGPSRLGAGGSTSRRCRGGPTAGRRVAVARRRLRCRRGRESLIKL